MDDKLIISPDRPLVDPKDDRFGYAPFASHLAESIVKMGSAEGFVVAIYGSWGSGKTTALNFVKHTFKQKPDVEQPMIVPFNPWLFSGHADLTRQFFNQLRAVIGKKLGVGSKVIKIVSSFAEAISETPVPYAPVGKLIHNITKQKAKDIEQLKANAVEALEKEKKLS